MSSNASVELPLHRKVKHTSMQHHWHDEAEWGGHGQLRLGVITAVPGSPAFNYNRHELMLTENPLG